MLQRLTTWLWYLLVLLIVLLAVYSSVGRLLFSNVARYQDDILRELNARLDFVLEIDRLEGSWQSLSPTITASGLRVLGDSHTSAALEFSELSLEFDVLDTLLARSPRLFTRRAGGGRVHVDVDENGRLTLAGIGGAGQTNLGTTLNEFIFNANTLSVGETVLELHDGDTTRVAYVDAELEREEAFRRAQLSLKIPERQSVFRLMAEGNGDLGDFAGFRGTFHLRSVVSDLGHYGDLLAQFGLEHASGRLDNDLWLRLDRGKIRLSTRLDGSDIAVGAVDGDARPLLMQRVGLAAQADYSEGRWDFLARDLTVLGDDSEVSIDKLAGSYGNDSLSLRLADLELGTLSRYLERAGLLPDSAVDVLAKLSPEGQLSAARFTLDELSGARDWRLEMNFSSLDVAPWRGAPGLTNASGYASLEAARGTVQLSSSDFSMAFPAVYRDPLSYRAFSAELEWTVADDAFRIRSGPFTALSDEGEVRGLFGLTLPRVKTPAGATMDLMVSLRDTQPEYRRKYLPYKLDANLLAWLEPSIGDGRIREGGFIYRGSLVGQPQYRTIQLFFDVENTRVAYHPDWPALESLDGLILIDGDAVDVYGSRARILGSEARDIRVQVRRQSDNQMRLTVAAAMDGDAGDGLAIVNNSPLRKVVGDSFADWSLEGGLSTRLGLEMNLSDAAQPPVVSVVTDWDEVDVDMGVLNLTVEDVSGTLYYDSDRGFHSDDLVGRLWGEQFSGRVSQGREEGELAPLDIAVTGPVAMESVRDWLELDLLRLAQGRTEAELHILVPTSGSASLRVESELRGVALDLPTPWTKLSASSRPTTLSMPLASGPRRVEIAMERQAFLAIGLDGEGFTGGSLGFGSPLKEAEAGRFLIGGKLGFLDWAEWEDWLDRYFPGEAAEGPVVLSAIRDLEVARLVLFGYDLEQITLSGRESAASWLFDFDTAWAAGTVLVPDDLARIDLSLRRLDVAGLGVLAQSGDDLLGTDTPMPPAKVTIDRLHDGDVEWGNLAFDLRAMADNLHFENITGNLRAIELGEEQGMRLDWLRGEDGDRTRLLGTLTFANFGDVLAEYNYEEIVETQGGRVELELAWPGGPNDFALVDTSGSMRVDVDQGSFLRTSGATSGTLRVVGILNLTEMVRRLSLDLSHVYKSGVPFDSIKGRLDFRAGMIDVPHIDVQGRGSRLQFVGLANAREATVDGELVATLPIASNLPWMFALVSGLPAAAGVYVISKLFDKQMDRFSSAVYSVEGPWSDPQVRFERIFDDSAEQPEVQTTESGEAGRPAEETPGETVAETTEETVEEAGEKPGS